MFVGFCSWFFFMVFSTRTENHQKGSNERIDFPSNMSDITTPGAVQTAISDLQRLNILNPTRFHTMLGDRPVFFLTKGRYATTDDGVHVCILEHTAIVDFDQSTQDEQTCLVQPCDETGMVFAESYREKYGKLTVCLQRYEKNIMGLALVLGIVPLPASPSEMRITQHIRSEVLALTRFTYELSYLNGKTLEEMTGEKAYTISINMDNIPDAELRQLSDEFMQIMGYAQQHTDGPDWMNGPKIWADRAAKFEKSITPAHRERLLLALYGLVDLRVVGKMVK